MSKDGDGSGGQDRSLTLLHFRKTLTALIKSSSASASSSENSNAGQQLDKLLPLFSRLMSMYTPDELAQHFKEIILFAQQLSAELVQEIKCRANSIEESREAAKRVYQLLRPDPPENRGWVLLNSITFIVNSGHPKAFEPLCKGLLPSTLVKVFYLFLDLPPHAASSESATEGTAAHEKEVRSRLYDSLVQLMSTLCSQELVGEELIQHDDLALLFIAASTQCSSHEEQARWRDANFLFLCTIVGKALSPAVVRYIHSKDCIGHYLKNLHKQPLSAAERGHLLSNMLDLLRSSADTTLMLIEDFAQAEGYQAIVDFCLAAETREEDIKQVFHALKGLLTAGDETVAVQQPATSLSNYQYRLPAALSRSTRTVRIPDAFVVLEKCFHKGSEVLSTIVLDALLELYSVERVNYFILEFHSSLYLLVEKLPAKSVQIQLRTLEVVEFILRELVYLPSKELTALNVQLRAALASKDYERAGALLDFFDRAIRANPQARDAYRELMVLESLLQCLELAATEYGPEEGANEGRVLAEQSLALLIKCTKDSQVNAQYVGEVGIDPKLLSFLLMSPAGKLAEGTTQLVRHTLQLARNEQPLGSLLQLLFANPADIPLCRVVLELLARLLLENHKVRIMFRKGGGYVCLMTLLLHLEGSLSPTASEEKVREDGHAKENERSGNEKFRTEGAMRHIALIFRILTLSMRYEPSNARHFLTEMKPAILTSVLRCLGCFDRATTIDTSAVKLWEGGSLRASSSQLKEQLRVCHAIFAKDVLPTLPNSSASQQQQLPASPSTSSAPSPPQTIIDSLCILRLLFDMALDNFDKRSNDIRFAPVGAEGWPSSNSSESIESLPPVTWQRAILVHPTAVLSSLQLLPSITTDAMPPAAECEDAVNGGGNIGVSGLEQWAVAAQLYFALVLKALLRVECNQQVMCQHDMPSMLLDVGAELFLSSGRDEGAEQHHPLAPIFYYLLERLACQSLRPADLRRFLRLDQPLCCAELDDKKKNKNDDGADQEQQEGDVQEVKTAGRPVPLSRIKALASMLAPRTHSALRSPAFIEFDIAVEGFACVFTPSIANTGPIKESNISDSAIHHGQRIFPPLSGFTFMCWLWVDECSPTSSAEPSHSISLINLVRQFDGTEAQLHRTSNPAATASVPNLEDHLTCFCVQLNMAERSLLISTAEHSVVDELNKAFSRPAESFVRVPLSEQYLPIRQWVHLAVIMRRTALLKQNCQAEVLLDGRLVASQQRLNYVSANAGGAGQTQIAEQQIVHALIGTPPFLRKPANLRWRMASTYLVDEPLSIESVRGVVALGPHYVGNLQSMTAPGSGGGGEGGSGALAVKEERLLLALSGHSTEIKAHQLKALMRRRVDAEITVSMLGISINDSSTPLRVVWNSAGQGQIASTSDASSNSHNQPSLGPTRGFHQQCGVLIGYLGLRTFAPCPVSALLDSVGGVAPLLGMVAMCNDSAGLYASLKVLLTAVETNPSIEASMLRGQLYQTLSILLEEKAHLMNPHILQLLLALTGTVDVGRGNALMGSHQPLIPNLQTFDELLCDLDVWRTAPDEVRRLLFEHFYELLTLDGSMQRESLLKVRSTPLLSRLLFLLLEGPQAFPVRNDIVFRLISAIVQPPCDAHSLLRLGQAIAATVPLTNPSVSTSGGDKDPRVLDGYEGDFPFHLAELEKVLSASAGGDGEGLDQRIYMVYVRNRLLNILATMLAHSSSTLNKQLCEAIVANLGFGWLFALCSPHIHPYTLLTALRILLSISRHPTLWEKFREGTANGGWLSDADSVTRNRAAVLLGFSVSAHGGAIGSSVDINPQLSSCGGFTALEHLMPWHARHPFAYLAVLALLFQRADADLQPLDSFNIDLIWSHVFSLPPTGSSVADALASVSYCPEALAPLLAMARAGIHYRGGCLQVTSVGSSSQDDETSWSFNYPVMVLQLITFLYQNSEPFFLMCHSESFVLLLFGVLTPFDGAPEVTSVGSVKDMHARLTAKESLGGGRCVRQILDLLTNILLNDLCLSREKHPEWLFDALVEFLECGGATCQTQSLLYTDLVNNCLDHFATSSMFFANSALMIPHSAEAYQLSHSSEATALNVVHFLSRVIDSVWNCLYRGNPTRILKCFLKLLVEAHASNKAATQIACTEQHHSALFRIMLYLLSRPIDNVDTQMSVLDTLAEIARNQHILLRPLSPPNGDAAQQHLFYGALVHLVFMLSEKPDIHQQSVQSPGAVKNVSPSKKKSDEVSDINLERGSAQVAMCAQSVWGILWQQKKQLLDELFKRDVDLDLYTSRAVCGEQANRYWLQFVDSQTDGSSSALAARDRSERRQNRALTTRLGRAARSGLQRLTGGSSKSQSFASALSPISPPLFHLQKPNMGVIDAAALALWTRVHLGLIGELLKSQCERYHQWHAHVRRWCLDEWRRMEVEELTRERGLWGPMSASHLDKYQLDIGEGGPLRVRKKLVPNPGFYLNYPYRPQLDAPEARAFRVKYAISKDSAQYYELMRKHRPHTMDARIIDTSLVIQLPSPQRAHITGANAASEPNISPAAAEPVEKDEPAVELDISLIRRMVKKNLALEKERKQSIESFEGAANYSEDGSNGEEDELVETTTHVGDEGHDEDQKGTNDCHPNGVLPEDSHQQSKAKTPVKEKSGDSPSPVHGTLTASNKPSSPLSRASPSESSPQHSGASGPDNQTLLRLLEQGEQLHSMFRCARIQGLDTLEGLLLFGREHYYIVDGFTLLKTREIRDLDFLPEQYHDPIIPYMAMGSSQRPISTRGTRQCSKFAYDDMREVHKRRYLLQPIALEVFSADGRNCLLAFPKRIRDRVYDKLTMMAKRASADVRRSLAEQKRLLSAAETAASTSSSFTTQQLVNSFMGQQSLTQRWQRGEISNFHYLMHLNTLAGRSYNDLSQYPVFPWVLADYHSEELDLTNPATFRDLSKPMGAQSAERFAQFLKRYREWDDPTGDTPPYMYGTHYSSAMIVLSYLVRIEPFTQQFLKLQGGHFDLADRMFHSIGDAYASASRNNMADVKELIPEFFYLPEMFLNANAFDLGVKQSGVRLDNVVLPKWAHGDVHEFIRLHREVLECDYVSEHLHEWIDLIFGYQQSGEPAKEANNVFHHLFYEQNVNFDEIQDPLTRNATLGFINNFGQVPTQLFKKPHPQRRLPTPGTPAPSVSSAPPLLQLGGKSPGDSSMVIVTTGVTTPRLFYHCLPQLHPSGGAKPAKELRSAAVGDIISNDKGQVIVLEQQRMLLPPSTQYLAWGFPDRSIRLGQVGDKVASVCLLETNACYEVTCMACTADSKLIFAGLTTGTVMAWTLTGQQNTGAAGRQLILKRSLDAHEDVVTALAACHTHNFLVSASRDSTAIVWHLTRLTLIRQLLGHSGAISAVAVNDASGDIATASGAQLRVWSLNGQLLAEVNTAEGGGIGLFASPTSMVLCLAFSTLNEWDANNVVMCGTSDGLVKIYSVRLRRQHTEAESGAEGSQTVDEVNSGGGSKPANAGTPGKKTNTVKEHFLRRQQRIQQHHHHRQQLQKMGQRGEGVGGGHGGDSVAGRSSSSGSTSFGSVDWCGSTAGSVESSRLPSPTRREALALPSPQPHQQQSPGSIHSGDGCEAEENRGDAKRTENQQPTWQRSLELRRVLTEHTAFNHEGNPHPAPITCCRPTRDHRCLLVGDGVGRVWLWSPFGSSST